MRFTPPREWGKLEVTRLGVDASLYSPPTRAVPVTIEILTVGRLAAVKAHRVLIDAMARLVRQGLNVRLRLVGDGAERTALESQAASLGLSDRIVFEGWQNQQRVHAFYCQADVFALPSFAEGIPVVLMEAMAMEIPCVATRITGIPELICDGEDGLLVTPADTEDLAAALARLASDPGLRRRLGAAGRQRVIAEYDQARNAAALGAMIKRRVSPHT
jgi:glycosyltransferase involved in cell wall biosynthesis